MVSRIIKYELRYWGKQHSIYIYAVILFVIGLSAMLIGGDILQEVEPNPDGENVVNSQVALFIKVFGQLNIIIFFLLATIYGVAMQRDFSSNMYRVLYSYPVGKFQYLAGKYISASIIAIVVVGCLGLGLAIGEHIPGLDPAFIGPFQPWAYFRIFVIHVVPNLLIFGGIIFAVVGLTRSIYGGYVTVLLVIIIRTLVLAVLGHPDYISIAAVLDPYSNIAAINLSKDWTLEQQNTLLIPFKGVLLFNRLLWSVIGLVLMRWAYTKFELSQHGMEPKIRLSKKKKNVVQKPETHKLKNLSTIHYNFSMLHQWITTWKLALIYLKSIVWSRMFLAILFGCSILMIVLLGQVNPELTTRMRPFTHVMLMIPTMFYTMLITILTFVYAGSLVHRDRVSKMNALIDATPVNTGVLVGSRMITIVLVQIILLSVIILVGVTVQTYNGYYNYEIGQYLFHLYGLTLISIVIWGMMAMFVQVILPNQYLGIFLLILALFGVAGLSKMGLDNPVFRFNDAPILEHSDMDGYGAILTSYFLHKLYWLFGGVILLVLSSLLWIRGHQSTIMDRYNMMRLRLKPSVGFGLVFLLFAFISMGSWIYINTDIEKPSLSKEGLIHYKVNAEKSLSAFSEIPQPLLDGLKVEMDIYPNTRTYRAKCKFQYVNKSTNPIDTIWVNLKEHYNATFNLSRDYQILYQDSILYFSILNLEEPMQPNDTLLFTFNIQSQSNNIFKSKSGIKKNGTFIMPDFPAIAIVDFIIKDSLTRVSNGLTVITSEDKLPSDSLSLLTSYVGTDLLEYEAIVSTSKGQIAITSGALKNDWIEDDRHYFHYKNKERVRNGFIYHSGKYKIRKERHRDVDLEVYYHPAHSYNINSMIMGMKATLDYCEDNYTPYQFDQMRIVEFPLTYGYFAQSFANIIPYSEMGGFMINIDTATANKWDSPFRLTSHEMSHQWWGHQIVPADVLGSKFVTEGIAEYVAAQVLGLHHGHQRLKNLLEVERMHYFKERNKVKIEAPLIMVPAEQPFVAYQKGCLALYSIGEYIGEEVLNRALGDFAKKTRLSDPPYTSSLQMLEYIEGVTPDSLQYLISDLLEKVIIYDNGIVKAKTTELPNGQYKIDINLVISKYNGKKRGEKIYTDEFNNNLRANISKMDIVQSLPLNDYIEIGFYKALNNGTRSIIYKKMYFFTDIVNHISVILDEMPSEVIVDPSILLLDANLDDNRKKI